MWNKIFMAIVIMTLATAMLDVVEAAMNINPVANILWFCAHASSVALMYMVRDWGKYKPSTGLPRYYTRNAS